MKKLILVLLLCGLCHAEGFVEVMMIPHFEQNVPAPMFTAPEDMVVLEIWLSQPYHMLSLYDDDRLFFHIMGRDILNERWYYPDGCLVIDKGSVISFYSLTDNNVSDYMGCITFIGYYLDQNTTDINGDGRVNLLDLSLLTRDWLE